MGSNTEFVDCSELKFNGKIILNIGKFKFNLPLSILMFEMLSRIESQSQRICKQIEAGRKIKKPNITSFKIELSIFGKIKYAETAKKNLGYFIQILRRFRQDKEGKVTYFTHSRIEFELL